MSLNPGYSLGQGIFDTSQRKPQRTLKMCNNASAMPRFERGKRDMELHVKWPLAYCARSSPWVEGNRQEGQLLVTQVIFCVFSIWVNESRFPIHKFNRSKYRRGYCLGSLTKETVLPMSCVVVLLVHQKSDDLSPAVEDCGNPREGSEDVADIVTGPT